MRAKQIVMMLGMAVALSGCESDSLPKYYHSMNNPNIEESDPAWLVQSTAQGYELTAWGRHLVAGVDPAAYEKWSDAMFSHLKTCKRGLEEQQAALSAQGRQDYGLVGVRETQPSAHDAGSLRGTLLRHAHYGGQRTGGAGWGRLRAAAVAACVRAESHGASGVGSAHVLCSVQRDDARGDSLEEARRRTYVAREERLRAAAGSLALRGIRLIREGRARLS